MSSYPALLGGKVSMEWTSFETHTAQTSDDCSGPDDRSLLFVICEG